MGLKLILSKKRSTSCLATQSMKKFAEKDRGAGFSCAISATFLAIASLSFSVVLLLEQA